MIALHLTSPGRMIPVLCVNSCLWAACFAVECGKGVHVTPSHFSPQPSCQSRGVNLHPPAPHGSQPVDAVEPSASSVAMTCFFAASVSLSSSLGCIITVQGSPLSKTTCLCVLPFLGCISLLGEEGLPGLSPHRSCHHKEVIGVHGKHSEMGCCCLILPLFIDSSSFCLSKKAEPAGQKIVKGPCADGQ